MAENKNVIVITNEENKKGGNKKPVAKKKDMKPQIREAFSLRAKAAAEYSKFVKTFGKDENTVTRVNFAFINSFDTPQDYFNAVYLMMKDGKDATAVLEKASKDYAEDYKAVVQEIKERNERIAALRAELDKLESQQ